MKFPCQHNLLFTHGARPSSQNDQSISEKGHDIRMAVRTNDWVTIELEFGGAASHRASIRAQCRPIERAEQMASAEEAPKIRIIRLSPPRVGWGECRMEGVCDGDEALSLFWDKQTAGNLSIPASKLSH